MISSTVPSAKYSCSGSPPRFWNGSTAIDGLSGRVGVGTEVDADTQHDAAGIWQFAVRYGHIALQVDCTLHGVNRATELDEHAVPSDLEDAAVVASNDRFQHLLPPGPQYGHCTGLILLHQPAVSDHIGRENGGEPALDAFFGHVLPL